MEAGAQSRRHNQLKSGPFASRLLDDLCHLLIRDLVRGFADLPRQVVVECFQRRASGRSLRHRLAKGRIGLPWTLKGAPADGVGQGTMIGMGGCLALPKRVALYQESFRGALEVSLLENRVI